MSTVAATTATPRESDESDLPFSVIPIPAGRVDIDPIGRLVLMSAILEKWWCAASRRWEWDRAHCARQGESISRTVREHTELIETVRPWAQLNEVAELTGAQQRRGLQAARDTVLTQSPD